MVQGSVLRLASAGQHYVLLDCTERRSVAPRLRCRNIGRRGSVVEKK